MACLSARCAEFGWGLLVSVCLRVLARVRRKGDPRVGLLGSFFCWARLWPRGLFLLKCSFLFLNSFSGMNFDMNSNPFEIKLPWDFCRVFVDSKIVIKLSGYFARLGPTWFLK